MCGIAGIIQRDQTHPSESVLTQMAEALQHRGPDAHGVWTSPAVGLAHARLAIVDLLGGSQPMTNAEHGLTVTFNGEIYNFPELRRQLRSLGWKFQTQCDTEILLALWHYKKTEMVHELDGMFAFALVDDKSDEVFLAVDRFGQKPLYYTVRDSLFAFASEPNALKTLPQLDWTLDTNSLHHYLSFLTVSPPRTIYKEMKRLAGGRRILYNLKTHKLQEDLWYHLTGHKTATFNEKEAQEELRRLLEEAVRKRLMSDVPLGAFLSSGIDSTIIAGLLQKVASAPLKTFTIGMDESSWDESPGARAVASHLKTDHHEKTVSPCDPDLFLSLVRHLGEPFADSSLLPTFQLAQFAREQVTVALSGDGADEAFGGYDRYRAMRWAGLLDGLGFLRNPFLKAAHFLLPNAREDRTLLMKLKRFCAFPQHDGLARYLALITHFTEEDKHSLYTDTFSEAALALSSLSVLETDFARAEATHIIEKIMNLDVNRYLQDDILVKIDRASMAVGLEVRSPFLDHKVMEFAANLPLELKIKGQTGKHILKETFRDYFPEGHASAPKKGFAIPLGRWFRGPLRDLAWDLLTDSQARQRGIFDPQSIEKLLTEHDRYKNDHGQKIWALLVFEAWCRST